MRTISTALVFFFIFIILGMPAYSRPQVAIGYIENKSKKRNYNYLETIFANSFGNSLRNIFDNIKVTKPLKLSRKLKTRNVKIKKSYKPHEFNRINKLAGTDFFISGNFEPLGGNRVRITLYVHKKNEPFYFTFSSEGRLETEMFRLVDRVSNVMIYYMTKKRLYKTARLQKGSRIGILTNIRNSELNDVYLPISGKGFKLTSIQGNEIGEPVINKNNVGHLYYLTTDNTGFAIISNPEKQKKPVKKAMKEYAGEPERFNEIITEYDRQYLKTFNRTLERFKNITGVDYLLIIAYNNSRTRAWLRCIDVNRRELVWIQSDIKGSSVYTIASKVTDMFSMTAKDIHIKKKSKKRKKK